MTYWENLLFWKITHCRPLFETHSITDYRCSHYAACHIRPTHCCVIDNLMIVLMSYLGLCFWHYCAWEHLCLCTVAHKILLVKFWCNDDCPPPWSPKSCPPWEKLYALSIVFNGRRDPWSLELFELAFRSKQRMCTILRRQERAFERQRVV